MIFLKKARSVNPPPLNDSYLPRKVHVVMPKEIRQIWIHLWGERRDRDTPTDRKECVSDKCTLLSAKPFPWWRIPQKPQQLPKLSVFHPFLCTTHVMNTGLFRFLFKKEVSVFSLWTSIHQGSRSTSQMSFEGLEEPCPGLGAGAEQQAAEQACSRAPRWAPGALAWHRPASLTLLRRTSEGLKDSPPPLRYAAQEMNAGCPTSSRLVLNFNLFGHLLNCY